MNEIWVKSINKHKNPVKFLKIHDNYLFSVSSKIINMFGLDSFEFISYKRLGEDINSLEVLENYIISSSENKIIFLTVNNNIFTNNHVINIENSIFCLLVVNTNLFVGGEKLFCIYNKNKELIKNFDIENIIYKFISNEKYLITDTDNGFNIFNLKSNYNLSKNIENIIRGNINFIFYWNYFIVCLENIINIFNEEFEFNNETKIIKEIENSIYSLEIYNNYLIVGWDNDLIGFYEIEDGELIEILTIKYYHRIICFTKYKNYLISGSGIIDYSIKIFNLENIKNILEKEKNEKSKIYELNNKIKILEDENKEFEIEINKLATFLDRIKFYIKKKYKLIKNKFSIKYKEIKIFVNRKYLKIKKIFTKKEKNKIYQN